MATKLLTIWIKDYGGKRKEGRKRGRKKGKRGRKKGRRGRKEERKKGEKGG